MCNSHFRIGKTKTVIGYVFFLIDTEQGFLNYLISNFIKEIVTCEEELLKKDDV